MTTPEQWPKIKEIVGAALEIEPSKRGAFLDRACSQDTELRGEVESLLSAHAGADALSEHPWANTVAEAAGESRVIGPYCLIRELGIGGMGQVWLAEQTEPVRRRVALKLIKAGMYDAAVVQRFQSERQSLAIMNHPAIAKVFDAGTTPEGQPYFAMEYVNGLPITDYCDHKKLGIRDRLKLFIQVCEGVQHAHQKAIIHRDLKPSNVLVIEVDGKPTPRIIDFGLAKAVAPVPGETMFTHVGAFLGTPGYMSPEQADPSLHDIDTRTDVYSLGVVLYELLTGYLPFDTTQWKKQRLDEVLRQLRETDPQRPSTKVSANRDTSTARAKARGTEAGHLVSLLRGDLDWITLKALEKERERRYGTPSALAGDVGNYLAHRPVEARPASTVYRLRKYVRRNRVAVAVASGAAALLIAFAVTQAVELRRITRERDRADRITGFMTNMFKVSDPSEARGNTITAHEILDKSSNLIEGGLSKDPEIQAQMMDLMGRVYRNLGLYPKAQELLTKAVEIRRRILGPEHADTLESTLNLANTLADEGKIAQADKLYRQVLEISRRVFGPADRKTLTAMNNIALDLKDMGRVPEAEKMQRETVEIDRRSFGPEHADTLTAMSNLALTLRFEGKLADAEKLNREVLDARRRTLGLDHPDALRSAANLALDLLEQHGRSAEAQQLLRPTLESQRRILGPAHPDTLESMNALAMAMNEEGRPAEGEALLRELLEIERSSLGPEHRKTLLVMNNLGAALDGEKKYVEAAEQFRTLLDIQRRLKGPEHYQTLLAMTNLAAVMQDEKQYAEAEKLGREALEIERRKFGDESPLTLEQMSNLANVFEALGRAGEAEKLLLETSEHQAHVFGADNPQTALSIYTLGAWAARRGERDKAIQLVRQAIEHGLDEKTRLGIEQDADLKSLRSDPRFTATVTEAKQGHASAQKAN